MGLKDQLKEKFTFNESEDVEANSITELEVEAKRVAELEEYNEKYPEPTEEDYINLRKTIGHAPYVTYLICLVEFAERASYYGVRDRLANFIQLPLPEGGNGAGAPPRDSQKNAGALGLGLRVSSAFTLLLTFLAYLTPLWGGYISDKKWGRLRTIWYGVWAGAIAHIVLIVAAIPSVITGGKALAPTVIAILLLALGTGLIKPNLLPLLYDQYDHKRDIVTTNKKGERVIVSKQTTLERMTLVFYWSINVGSFLSLGTSYCAKRIGFWLAFLIPGIAYIIMIPVLILLKPKLKKETPNGVSIIEEALKVLVFSFKSGWIGRIRRGEFWEYAKPANIAARGNLQTTQTAQSSSSKKGVSWTDQFVDDVRVTIDACAIFLFFVVYNINDGGIGNIENSQANSMTTNGVPNDLISNFNPLTIIVLIPILDYCVYPVLRKLNIDFRPVYRIFFGFILAALSQVAGAIIQWKVYKTSPCGYYATDCNIGSGVSNISVWVETVLYVLGAASECFANTAAYEIAYTRAPENMKGLVMALFLFAQSLSAAVSQAASASLVDPYLIWPFVACAVVGFLLAFWFLWLYRDLHKVMEKERLEKEELLRQEYLEHLRTKNEFSDKISAASINERLQAEDEVNKIQAIESALSAKRV